MAVCDVVGYRESEQDARSSRVAGGYGVYHADDWLCGERVSTAFTQCVICDTTANGAGWKLENAHISLVKLAWLTDRSFRVWKRLSGCFDSFLDSQTDAIQSSRRSTTPAHTTPPLLLRLPFFSFNLPHFLSNDLPLFAWRVGGVQLWFSCPCPLSIPGSRLVFG